MEREDKTSLSKVIGIISWFPEREPERGQRMGRLKQLLLQIEEKLPLPVIVIAQNWMGFRPKTSLDMQIFESPKLGIIRARQKLRKRFLESEYDYLIMFDDDAIIQESSSRAISDYLSLMDENPMGFAFCKKNPVPTDKTQNPYADSQLNFCAISRYIYNKEEMSYIDAEKSMAFEDRVFSMLLHIKYPKLEFDVPRGIVCTHFKNKSRPLPSTWAKNKKLDWCKLRDNTLKIERYICENKDIPQDIISFLNQQEEHE